MDYLDRKKEMRNRILLFSGYVLIGVALVMTSLVLLYQAYGFGLGKNGTVIQNGLTFFSSHPNPSQIYINGQKSRFTTNTRMALPEGVYKVKLSRSGYLDWQRTIELEGGSVQHFDYPFLIPKALSNTKVAAFTSAPGLMTQSPDHRWYIVLQPGSNSDFQVYDLKNPTKAPLTISLPANLLTKAASQEGWQLVEWADDNKHVILQHNVDGKNEFVVLDRVNSDQAVNLNKTLSINPSKLTLKNKKFDQYYIYEAANSELKSISLKTPSAVTIQKRVLEYHSYGNDTLLYATDSGAPPGKVWIKLAIADKTYKVRILPAGSMYLLDLAKYSGDMYVAAGASSGDKVYIYKDPVDQLAKLPNHAVVPSQVLHVEQPNHLSFSASAQFIVAENGTRFGVYDIENEKGFNYSVKDPLDPPQVHANWMDGNRLTYVSGGRVVIYDYDATNRHVLVSASPAYIPGFGPDFKYLYVLAPAQTPGQVDLNQTPLLTATDL
jgi:hypothetical protein